MDDQEAQKPVVLIVEDNLEIQQGYEDLLHEKVALIQVSNADEGREVLDAIPSKLRVVVMDLLFQGRMTTDEFYRRICEHPEFTGEVIVASCLNRHARRDLVHSWTIPSGKKPPAQVDKDKLPLRVLEMLHLPTD